MIIGVVHIHKTGVAADIAHAGISAADATVIYVKCARQTSVIIVVDYTIRYIGIFGSARARNTMIISAYGIVSNNSLIIRRSYLDADVAIMDNQAI